MNYEPQDTEDFLAQAIRRAFRAPDRMDERFAELLRRLEDKDREAGRRVA